MSNNKFQRFLGVALTMLMVGYLTCLSFSVHTHIVDAKVITHSHPYQSSSHTHSGLEFVTINALSHFEALQTVQIAIDKPIFALLQEVDSFSLCHAESFLPTLTLLRAPPVFG